MTRQLFAAGTFAALLLTGACSTEKKSDALATDTALSKDLAMANRDTTAQPALKDVAPPAAAPAPVVEKPAATKTVTKPVVKAPPKVTPKPAPVEPVTTPTGNTVTTTPRGSAPSTAGGNVGTIASGTSIGLRSNARVCTNTYTVGQTFTATAANAVSGSNGAAIPAGATFSLEVTNLKRSENSNDKIVMEFAVHSVSFGGRTYPVSASVNDADIERVRNQPQSKDVQKVATGAVIGGIAGKIFGKSTKATVIGAAAGAAAGAGVAAGTANYEGCVADGGNIAITLNSALQVKLSS